MLIVEAKGFSILISTLMNNDIEKNNSKLFTTPILEANECFYNIKNSRDDVEEIYIVSVTMDSINAVPQYIEDIKESIEQQHKNNEVPEYYFNFNIEEYEMLMKQIELGKDIFTILHNYDLLPELMPFSNYLREYYSVQMTDFMSRVYNDATREMQKLYGIYD